MSADNETAILEFPAPGGGKEYRLAIVHAIWAGEEHLLAYEKEAFAESEVFTSEDDADIAAEKLEEEEFVEYGTHDYKINVLFSEWSVDNPGVKGVEDASASDL